MWLATGAVLTDMDVDHHDEVLAATSHLPHMLAYALVDCLAGMDGADEIFTYAAGGFRDFTRIASSDPAMWCDIALDNRTALLTMLDRFNLTYTRLREALDTHDREALQNMFDRAKSARDSVALPAAK
jgi:prephenate dehydrogenase